MPSLVRYSIAMLTHPLHLVRFESVACLNPLLDASLLVVDPQAWFAARRWLTANPRSLARAESLDARVLDALLNTPEAFEGVSRIIGLGGGTAIDTAKYLAWRTGLPLTLVPSALTVDAPFTRLGGGAPRRTHPLYRVGRARSDCRRRRADAHRAPRISIAAGWGTSCRFTPRCTTGGWRTRAQANPTTRRLPSRARRC
jgi:hypothetical protein